MVPVPASVAKQAEILKDNGNSYFKKGRLLAAIEAYTEVEFFTFWVENFLFRNFVGVVEGFLFLRTWVNFFSFVVKWVSCLCYLNWNFGF